MTKTELALRILISIGVLLVGLGIGLWLRRLLVRRLKKTVLDEWLTHTLGVIVFLPPLLIAAGGALDIFTNRIDWLYNAVAPYQAILGNLAGKFIGSILIVIFAVGTARTLSRLTLRGLGENRLDINIRILINRISYILVFLVAIFWILNLWQIAIELPVAVLGTLTVAITFSIQDIAKDLVAGIYILLERPFHIGDQISTADYTGKVVGVELRATRLRLVSGEEIIIPNALVFSGIVINNSRYAERRAVIEITLLLEDFHREETPATILTSIKDMEEVLRKPEPGVTVSGIVDDKVVLTLRFWIINGQFITVTDVMYTLRTLLPGADFTVKEGAGDV